MSCQWDFYFSNVNNSPASIFVDLGLREISPSADNPWLLWVWVQFNHRKRPTNPSRAPAAEAGGQGGRLPWKCGTVGGEYWGLSVALAVR
jgi:hypothetical protein